MNTSIFETGTAISADEIERRIAEARRLRAEVIGRMIGRLFRRRATPAQSKTPAGRLSAREA